MKTILVVLCLAMAFTLVACGGKSDADLQKAAETAVKAKVPTATVTVKDGVATITGVANDAAAKTAAEAAAKVEGIKSVTNNMTVATPTPVAQMASGDDTKVKTAIEDNWKKAGCTGATVTVKDGTATGIGTVPKGKLATCVQAAQEAKPGKFDNKLAEAK